MEFPDTLDIEGQTYTRVDIQREEVSAIYKNATEYVRIGDEKKILADLEAHKAMEQKGFPVASLLGEGRLGDMYYFKEASLGDDCFGRIFEKECIANGEISDSSWEQLVRLCERFASAQLQTITETKNLDAFKSGIHIDFAFEEAPDHCELFTKALKVVEERISVHPFALTHGDLSPFNTYPSGIIDLEDSFFAPVGYDLGAFIDHLEWFPKTSNDSMYQKYNFTPLQRSTFIERIDCIYTNAGLAAPSTLLREYNFAKGVWFAVRLDDYPILQKFRYDHLVECAHDLLAPAASKA